MDATNALFVILTFGIRPPLEHLIIVKYFVVGLILTKHFQDNIMQRIHPSFLCLFLADIDECAEGSHICDSNAECTNTIGSHNCTCVIGYSGNGSSCGKYCCHHFLTFIPEYTTVKNFSFKMLKYVEMLRSYKQGNIPAAQQGMMNATNITCITP